MGLKSLFPCFYGTLIMCSFPGINQGYWIGDPQSADTIHIDIESQIPSNGNWDIDCPSGYQEQVSQFDCRDGGKVFIPEDDLFGQFGFWTTCEDRCKIKYWIQPEDTNFGARVYQKNLETEISYDGITWEFVKGDGWVDITRVLKDGETEISMQFPHFGSDYFVVLDRLVVNGELPPVNPLTTTQDPDTDATLSTSSSFTTGETEITTQSGTDSTSETMISTSEAMISTSETMVSTSEAMVSTSEAMISTSEAMISTSEVMEETTITTETSSTTEEKSTSETEVSSSSGTTTFKSSASTFSSTKPSTTTQSSAYPTTTDGKGGTKTNLPDPIPSSPISTSTATTVETTTKEDDNLPFSWSKFFTGKWGILIYSFIGAVITTILIVLCSRCICSQCSTRRNVLGRRQRASDLQEILSSRSNSFALNSSKLSVTNFEPVYIHGHPRAILRESTPYMIHNEKGEI